MHPFVAVVSEQEETHWKGTSVPLGPSMRVVPTAGCPPSYRNSMGWSGQATPNNSDIWNVASVWGDCARRERRIRGTPYMMARITRGTITARQRLRDVENTVRNRFTWSIS